MKVALLVCDHVNKEYQEEFGDYPQMFANLFPSIDFSFYDAINGVLPTNIEAYDAFMATGSRYSVYDDEVWIKQLLQFVGKLYKNGKCMVGYCFGHQLIGHALGGEVRKSEKGWCVGVQTFKPIGFNLLMMCQDQIEVLPEKTEVLGSSELCKNGIIVVDKRFLGIQAHPEFSKKYDRLLMEKRVERIGFETVENGIESLKLAVDKDTIRQYILRFIEKNM